MDDRAYRPIMIELLDDIVSGKLAAGAPLPRDSDIAARYACSPTVAREAVRALEERSAVEVTQGQGKTVLAADRWKLLDRDVAEAALVRHRDRRLLREAVDFFQLMEIQAGMLAARRLNRGDADELEQVLGQMRDATRGGNGAESRDERFLEAEVAFHRHLVLISGNRFTASALEHLHRVLVRARRQRAADRDPSVLGLHENIVQALRRRDPKATAAAIESYGQHLASWLRL
jgi:GntR family transcriptional regulator, transcriptional repressor for pyruvate dehydrogenase complex